MAKRPTRDRVAAVQAADRVVYTLRAIAACDRCQAPCYTFEAEGLGEIGGALWGTTLDFREHVPENEALMYLAARASVLGRAVWDRHRQIAVREMMVPIPGLEP